MVELPDYVIRNREHWDCQASDYAEMGERAWESEPRWGIWHIPESDLGLLPEDMSGMDVIELGCGTGYVSAWMSRRGAKCVGIDISEHQLATARGLAEVHGVELELIQGNAETVPFPEESFDFAISEYGVAIWADPYKWVPEAFRVLRPGGGLSFLGNHPLVVLTQPRDQDVPATRELLYPYFGMYRVDWDVGDDRGTEFHLPISEWLGLFDDVGFDVVEYHELRSPRSGNETVGPVTADWARDFPAEQVWKLRKNR